MNHLNYCRSVTVCFPEFRGRLGATDLLRLRARKVELGIAVHWVTLVRPRSDDLAFRLGPRPEPARVKDPARHVKRLVLLTRILSQLHGGVADNGEIHVQHPRRQVHDDDFGLGELEVLILVRRLDGVAAGIVLEDGPAGPLAEHAVAGHLEVDDVLSAVLEGRGDDPLDALATAGETLKRLAVGSPHGRLIIAVPVKLDVDAIVTEGLGQREMAAEPVRRSRGAKGFAGLRVVERVGVGRRLEKCRARWCRVRPRRRV